MVLIYLRHRSIVPMKLKKTPTIDITQLKFGYLATSCPQDRGCEKQRDMSDGTCRNGALQKQLFRDQGSVDPPRELEIRSVN